MRFMGGGGYREIHFCDVEPHPDGAEGLGLHLLRTADSYLTDVPIRGPMMPQEKETRTKPADLADIRRIVAQHGHLSGSIDSLADDSDLYLAGLTSLATVNVMLMLENHFDIEFPDSKLGRVTFSSIESIAEVVAELKG
jgi:acyl carrier protein